MLPDVSRTKAGVYRLILGHGDFGIHNMIVDSPPTTTCLFDWETGCIVPALLSDSSMAVGGADLITGPTGRPELERIRGDALAERIPQAKARTARYHDILFEEAPQYRGAIESGGDSRYLWFALKAWWDGDLKGSFGGLGDWAEGRMHEMGR